MSQRTRGGWYTGGLREMHALQRELCVKIKGPAASIKFLGVQTSRHIPSKVKTN
jgi:hypothetical protein